MAEEIVKVISIDTRKGERSIKDLKNEIKALKKELESAVIGSKDFDQKVEQLGRLQKEYKSINEEIVASSKPVQKQMFELARFGENLAKSYSAINAAMGLLADGNEDVQIALAKTARWIQLIQGLSGFKGLLNDIPKLRDNFKGFIQSINPLEKKIDNVAKSVSGISAATKTVGWTLIIGAILTAVTALIKWGSALSSVTKKQRELNKAISESANEISSNGIIALKELSARYKAVGNAAEAKKQFLVDFKKEIEDTGLAIKNVSQADDAFINNTPAYVDALKQRAKAQAIQSKATEIYQEYLDEITKLEEEGTKMTFWQTMSLGMMRAEGARGTEGWEGDLIEENAKKAQQKISQKTAEIEATLDKLFGDIFDLEKRSESYFTKIEESATEATAESADAKAEELNQLKRYYDEALKLFMDARTRELKEVEDKYTEQIELAQKYNEDATLLESAKQKEVDAIIEKFNKERLQKQKDDVEAQLQVIQSQIDRIRRMSDTSNLADPNSQNYTTNYHQSLGKAFMGGSSFSYQSGEDVENQVLAQITYNNQILSLTQSRIEQENALLTQQLEIVGITAERKLEIERTLRENEIALSDAVIKNEADNLTAYRSLQEKKNTALQSSLSVASSIFSSMVDLAGEETKAGKAFAVTQAVIDTYSAANSAYSSMAGIPYVGPALGVAAAAAAIASGIANVKSILSTRVSSDINDVSISTGAVATAPTLSTPPIEYTRNLLGNKEVAELNKSTKVYVLESDITEVQNRVKVVEDNASF